MAKTESVGESPRMPRPVIGIVCGIAAEREVLGALIDDPRVAVRVAGARPAVAEAETTALAALGCRLIVSWGIAGGLAPGLAAGDVVVPREVVSEGGEVWEMAVPDIDRAMMRPVSRLLGIEHVATEVTEKQALAAASGAALVDMESHRVARAAGAAGVPAMVWRSISDPAGRALPALVSDAVTRDGHPAYGRILLGLARRPFDLPSLIAAGRDSREALAGLAASLPALNAVIDNVAAEVIEPA
ncbi:MAG: phosphorylase [Pseudomonadota bacterium]